MDPVLRIQLGQERLTPEQEAEVRRFAAERIAAQLSTDPVDESETERLLHQAYAVARLPPPQRIFWLDGPLHLVAVLAPETVRDGMEASVAASVRDMVRDMVKNSVWASVEDSVRSRVEAGVEATLWTSVQDRLWTSVGYSRWASAWPSMQDRLRARVGASLRASVEAGVWDSVMHSVRAGVWDSLWASMEVSVRQRVVAPSGYGMAASLEKFVWASVLAYDAAPELAVSRFLGEYLTPNAAAHALAHFNERVSGYWLGRGMALLVRRPTLLARDEEGRLHSATGACIEYRDGWGFYAWHGVRVPEQVILDPDGLTRDDFLSEPNVEVRRVIQERMGSRFVPELGGVVLDEGPRGTLYEVRLPNDPERVARYVQVQDDASTPRQYFLRVPPTIQTAAEAVAWSFQMAEEVYDPAQET